MTENVYWNLLRKISLELNFSKHLLLFKLGHFKVGLLAANDRTMLAGHPVQGLIALKGLKTTLRLVLYKAFEFFDFFEFFEIFEIFEISKIFEKRLSNAKAKQCQG